VKNKFKRQLFLVGASSATEKKIRRGFEKYNAKIVVVENLNDFLPLEEQLRIDALILGNEMVKFAPFVRQMNRTINGFPIIFLCENEEQIQYVKDCDASFSALDISITIRKLNEHICNQKIQKTENSVFSIGKYTFDYKKRLLSIMDDKTQKTLFQSLTKKEAGILLLLSQRMNLPVLRTKILNTVWYNTSYNYSRSMDVYISFIRKYLSLDSNVKLKNIHSRGFMLCVEK